MTRAFALLLLCLGLTACHAATVGAAPLVVASDLDNHPFAWVDERGTPRGRDVEMMELVAAELGRELVWERVAFERLIDECEAGRVDVLCATLGITEERARRVSFTRPYFETEIAVVVRSAGGEPRSLAELAGKRVAAGAGTTSQLAVQRHLLESAGVFENKAERTTAERLDSGEIDAAVMDGPAADSLVRDSGGALRRLEETLSVERYALCVPRGRAALTERLDAALEKLSRAGTLAKLNARHGLVSSDG